MFCEALKDSDKTVNWNEINWKLVEKKIYRLQKRIFRASQSGDVKRVHSAHCGLTFRDGDLMEVDHIIPKAKGGKDEYKNLQLLHRHCHDDKTARDGSLNCTHDKGLTGEEPYEVKVSRTVLKTSVSGDTYT